jgi:anthranilate phosphoribosyltransferase
MVRMAHNPPFTSFTDQIRSGSDLSRDQMRCAFEMIMSGEVAHAEMADFLRALTDKGESVEEIAGAADVLNEKVTRVPCDLECADTCGTGGDGINTFNVSTTAAIIAAAAGAIVAKHGNHTSTRVSGSADVIAQLGVRLDPPIATLTRCLCVCGIAFLHAPLLHPAMKHAAPVRRELRIRTIFNLIGPLTNPAGARRQVIGTCKPELTEKIGRVLMARNAPRAWVPCSHEGLCDLSITGESQVTEVRDGQVSTFSVHPSEVGLQIAPIESLLVDSPAASAAAVRSILRGQDRGPRRDHSLLNAGSILIVAGLADDLKTAVLMAGDAVDGGAAYSKLEQLVTLSHA